MFVILFVITLKERMYKHPKNKQYIHTNAIYIDVTNKKVYILT